MRGESAIRPSGRTLPVAIIWRYEQRCGRAGELRIADRPECGFDGRAQRTGHRPEWSGDDRSVGGGAEPRNQRKQSAETNHTGLYRFLALTPGSYSIAVEIQLK
jgi:hypothetical protein